MPDEIVPITAHVLDDNGVVDNVIVKAAAPDVDITALKEQVNKSINLWRAQANQSFFTHMGKQIACDQLSRSDIDAIAGSISLTSAYPVGFPLAWKAIDNTYLSLPDADAFKAMYGSMVAQGMTNFSRSQALKTMLNEATTESQINALEW